MFLFIALYVWIETAYLLFAIFVLPVLLTLLIILKLTGVKRFKLGKLSLKVLLLVWLLSCGYTASRFIVPAISDLNSDNMAKTQATLLVKSFNYPLLISSDAAATYGLQGLNWHVTLNSQASFTEQPLTNTTDPYFQPNQGQCDIGSLSNSQPTEGPDSFPCNLVKTYNNGLTLYKQSYDDLTVGLFKNLLLIFDQSSPITSSKLDNLYSASSSQVLQIVNSKQFTVSGYNDALNRWYNQKVHQRCLFASDDCPFSL